MKMRALRAFIIGIVITALGTSNSFSFPLVLLIAVIFGMFIEITCDKERK